MKRLFLIFEPVIYISQGLSSFLPCIYHNERLCYKVTSENTCRIYERLVYDLDGCYFLLFLFAMPRFSMASKQYMMMTRTTTQSFSNYRQTNRPKMYEAVVPTTGN